MHLSLIGKHTLSLSISLSIAALSQLYCILPASADADVWQSMFNEAVIALTKGDLSRAEKSFTAAGYLSKRFGDQDIRYLKTQEGLATVLGQEHKYKEAEAIYARVLAIKEKNFAGQSPEVALTQGNMADLAFYQSQYARAEALYKSCLAGLTRGSVPYIEKMQNLAVCYTQDGDYTQAEALLQEALKFEGIVYGADSRASASSRANLVNVLIRRGNYQAAEDNANQILVILANTPGDDTAAATVRNGALNDLTIIYERRGKYQAAEDIARKVLANFQAIAPDGSESAKALHNLARVLREEKKYAESEIDSNKARTIFEKFNEPYLADALAELGNLYLDQGKYDKAEDYYRQAKALREKTYGQNHPDIAESCCELANIAAQKNDYLSAEALYKRALDIYKDTITEKNPDYAETLAGLGVVLAQAKDNANAEQYLSQALASREKILPADHPDLALSINQLAGFYKDTGAFAKAEPLYRRLLTMDRAAAKSNQTAGSKDLSEFFDARSASDLDNLAAVLSALNKKAEALPLKAQSNKLKRAIPGAIVGEDAGILMEGGPDSAKKDSDRPIAERYCLSIGVSTFKDPQINLRYAAKDATDFANFMGTSGGFPADHVKLLVDKEATRENIIATLGDKWLGKVTKPDDLVVIYISSHGSQALQEAGGANFLVAYDTNRDSLLASGIPMQWLSEIIKEQVHCNRVLLILDVCHSGSAATSYDKSTGGDSHAAAESGGKGILRTPDMQLSKIPVGMGQIVLCSSGADQISWESKEYPNSVFTRRLIESLSSRGKDTTLKQAYAVMRDKVENEVLNDRGQAQTPLIKSSWQGADLKPLANK